MPIEIPPIDRRRYRDLVDEALARVPAHTPEWTNLSENDPGVALVEVFAFMTESMLYRANRIPERNELAFLRLLGIPLQPGVPASGLLEFRSQRGTEVVPLVRGVEARAGSVSFRTLGGLDLLPVEAFVCAKVALDDPSDALLTYYEDLYAAQIPPSSPKILLYQTVPLGVEGIDIDHTVDRSLWIALLAPDKNHVEEARQAIGGRVLNVGLCARPRVAEQRLGVGDSMPPSTTLSVYAPQPDDPAELTRPLLDRASVPAVRAVLEVPLPEAARLGTWTEEEPLSAGVGTRRPPALDTPALSQRLVAWIRVYASGATERIFEWVGINAVEAVQGDRVTAEDIGRGGGEPDQIFSLGRAPVVRGSIRVRVDDTPWAEIEDLATAPLEGTAGSTVFQVDLEAGKIRFGDGLRGARPRRDATIRASYEVNAGRAGNVPTNAVAQAVGLPGGIKLRNPVPMRGGTDPETVTDGKRQVAAWLRHRDRLVTADDFRVLALRTPGARLARVEVLPAFDPRVSPDAPGDVPGIVTLVLLPPIDPAISGPPSPDDSLIGAVCDWLEPRRLITTELHLRGPSWVRIAVSVGLNATDLVAGAGLAEVRQRVILAIRAFLSPVPGASGGPNEAGWPLRKAVRRAELLVTVARVEGVRSVGDVLLSRADGSGLGSGAATVEEVTLQGLELPWIDQLSVVVGEPTPLSWLRGAAGGVATVAEAARLPLPVVPDACT